MDTFDESFDPACYRIMSGRRKERRIRNGRERLHAQLRREVRQLHKQYWKREPVPLEKPYQRGWVRYFVLRDDVRRDPKAEMYENILREINRYKYSNNKQFVRKKGRKNRKPNYVPIAQELKVVPRSVFESPKFPLTDAEKALFRKEEGWRYRKQLEWEVYVFTEQWRFVPVVRPHMITEMFPVDRELESRIRWIDNYFERRGIPLSRYSVNSWRYWKEWTHPRYAYEYKNKPLREIASLAKENNAEDFPHGQNNE